MILDSPVDRFMRVVSSMTSRENTVFSYITQNVKTLHRKLHNCGDAGRCCNCLKENNYSAQIRLALHHHSSTLSSVQLRILG